MRQILLPDIVLSGADLAAQRDAAVLVSGAEIEAVGPRDRIAAQAGDATRIELPGCLLMPGLVNAHQHGRGITQLQLGFPDDVLEIWFPSHRKSGVFDPYSMTLLAALRMIAGGVTTAIHANTGYGSGDYPGELQATIGAYERAGLRVFVGVGAMDRAGVVYPEGEAGGFREALPREIRDELIAAEPELHCRTAASAEALLDRLSERFDGNGRVKLGYAPAGPQWASDGLLSGILRAAGRRGVGVHLHGLESFAQVLVVQDEWPEGFLAHLARLGPIDERISIGHAVWLSEHDAEIAAKTGVTPVRNPASNLRLRAGIAPLAEYLERGVRVAIGTDNMGLNDEEDLFQEMRLAGALARSPLIGGTPPPSPLTMLRTATMSGAVAAQVGAVTGALEPGRKADMIAMDLGRLRDGYVHPGISDAELVYHRAAVRDVRMTMIDGRILWRDGAFADHDIEQVRIAAIENVARAQRAVTPEHAARVDRLVGRIAEHYRARETASSGAAGQAPWRPIAGRGHHA